MKKKILFIPSWYPNKTNKVLGSNYRLQIQTLSEKYNVFVLSGHAIFLNSLKFITTYFFSKEKTFELHTPPNGKGFVYYQLKTPLLLNDSIRAINYIEKLNYILLGKQFKKQILKIYNKELPNIIHAFSAVNGGIAAYYLSHTFSIPYVISEHQTLLMQQYSKYKQTLVEKVFEKANGTIAVSEHQKRQLLINYLPCKPFVIGNLMNENLFKIFEIDRDKRFTILTVTYINPIKGYTTFLEAIKYLLNNYSKEIKVIVIGSDKVGADIENDNNPLYKLAKEYNIEKSISFIPKVEKDQMPLIYNQADVYVSTSIAETFGMAPCEALLCGVPVVSTSNGGIDDIITKHNGIKVPSLEPVVLAKAIMSIKENYDIYNKDDLRESIINKFGVKIIKQKLTKFYEHIINNK